MALLLATCVFALSCTHMRTASGQFIQVVDEDAEQPDCQGTTPPNVVISQALPYPETGNLPYVVLRNIGGQVANLTGWKLTDDEPAANANAKALTFSGEPPCEGTGNFTIKPSRTLTITPNGPCGFTFELNFQDAINLLDDTGTVVSSVNWEYPVMGRALYRKPDGSGYYNISTTGNVMDTLKEMGGYDTFLQALEATGLAKKLEAQSDPSYAGPPGPPPKKTKTIVPEFPWWFGFSVNRTNLTFPGPPPPPPPPPAPGVPPEGPYTLLAPTDEAFGNLLRVLGGGRQLPKEQLYQLPELTEILRYHILPGRITTDDMYNGTGIFTAQGPQVTPFNDACMSEGKMRLHDSCIDKPTPDNYTCGEQVEFSKCYFPFMTSALAAQWQGGFCQASCQRCSCADGSGIECAEVLMPDVVASNGIVHGVSRVMFPPPVFKKSDYANMTIAPELAAALNNTGPLAVEQGPAVPAGVVTATSEPL